MTTAGGEDWSGFEVAIIGMSGRFPGAADVTEFWANLRGGVESISVRTDEELLAAGVDRASLDDPHYVKAASVLADIDQFDAAFFGVTPREAEIMDPQQRLFLECAWEALESGGYDPARSPGPVGVFGGASTNSYFLNNLQTAPGVDVGGLPTLFGNQPDYLTTRVSYKLGLKGPSLDVQTGCSSSLVAVHLACQALIAGECDLALAGGVGVMVPHGRGYVHQEQGIYSPDGRCRAFSDRAEGTVGGSGVAVVSLRRLSDALEDGDPIVAVIKGTAINNDGSDKIGYAAPSVDGQAQVIRNALAMADVEASSIGYIETHGTGTALGDPIEIAALTAAFGDGDLPRGGCAIGSLKTNVGHLDAAAGVAGLIKASLALQHRELPPSLNCDVPDPAIDFPSTPFRVNTELTPWQSAGPRRAGVSSFGIGGTNAHVVLQEPPARAADGSAGDPSAGHVALAGDASPHSHAAASTHAQIDASTQGHAAASTHAQIDASTQGHAVASEPTNRPQLLVLSARGATALDQACDRLGAALASHNPASLADVSYTLAVGRHDFAQRRWLVVHDHATATQLLGDAARGSPDRQRVRELTQDVADRSAAFMFPGQGAQYMHMGRDLYERLPVFKEQVDKACELLGPELKLDLRELLFADAEAADGATEQLGQTALTQPALFVIEHALAQQFMSWGVTPTAMIGHSIGEYVAAVLAGVFSLAEGLALVAARGRLMQDLPAGDMLAVMLPSAEVEPLLGAELSLAAANEPAACVVSGPSAAVTAFAKAMADRDVATRELHTSHAFHSSMMDEILAPFAQRVAAAKPQPPKIPFVSTLTGTWITDAEATDPDYWARHLRGTVRFADGLTELLGDDRRVLLEVGPGNTLTSLATRITRHHDGASSTGAVAHPRVAVAGMRHPRDAQDDEACLLNALGQLWAARVTIDWDAVHHGGDRRRVTLPTYSFQRQRFWIDAGDGAHSAAPTGKLADIADWFSVPSWVRSAAPLQGGSSAPPAQVLVLGGAVDDSAAHSLSGALADALCERLADQGVSVLRVKAGQGGAAAGAVRAIDPASADDSRVLCDGLAKSGQWPEAVLHLWSLDGADDDGDGALTRGFFSVLNLAQAMDGQGDGRPVEWLTVSRRLAAVSGDETLLPEVSTLLGVAQAVTQEFAGLTARTVDIDLDIDMDVGVDDDVDIGGETAASAAAAIERAAPLVLAELTASAMGQRTEPLVAWRGRHRWVARYESVRVEGDAGAASRPPRPLRRDGHYLITGGLGSIGLEVAANLARAPGARLVLVSRSAFPHSAEWDGWLAAHDADDLTSMRIARLQALIAGGAQVRVAQGDVTEEVALGKVLADAERRFGPLHGVVHAAGAEKTMTLLSQTSPELCLSQLGPKREGLIALEQLLDGRALDFCIVQSSLSSCLGALGMVGYVAAHHYVDAFVARHNATSSQPWTSANWDNWLTWKEPEFAHEHGGAAAYYMTPAEGAKAFARVLALPAGSQVAVSTGDLSARIDEWVRGTERSAAHDADSGQQLHERPDLGSEYAAPSTLAECALVTAWGESLGIGEIGIHDNFFELGGDSVLGLAIVAKLGQQGFHITPAQIFEHPTIAGLGSVAEVSGTDGLPQAEQGLVSGAAPLLPIQQWFFGQDIPERQHFNLPMLFEVPESTTAEQLSQALGHVVAHHDALRLRYAESSAGWVQSHSDDPGTVPVRDVDLSHIDEGDRAQTMVATADELHQGFDLARGPLMSAGLFHHGQGRAAQVLWVIHHLLVDVVSWRTLIADLTGVLAQQARGEQAQLPPKTTSFKAWCEALKDHAASDAMRGEATYWQGLAQASPAPLPCELDAGENLFSSSRTVTVSLDAEQTRALIHDVPPVYETRIDEVLLTALLLSLTRWTGGESVLVDLEGHGRQDVVKGCDVSRTVGWFTTLYPAQLSLNGQRDLGETLKSVKEQVRGIPQQGVGFGLLRYLCDDDALSASMAALPAPELNFLYLGQFDNQAGGSGIALLDDVSGSPCNGRAPRAHLLEIVAFVIGGKLQVELSFSEHRHERQTMEKLAASYIDDLKALIAHCQDPTAGGHTPSDFPAAKVSQKSLDKLLNKLGKGGKGKFK